MENAAGYRHELKYSINISDYLSLKQRLAPIMQRDAHADSEGRYIIRSVYFDNYRDKALREKIDGVQLREKFRIRYYNDDFSFIVLEKKIKHNDLCMKLDAPISYSDFLRILQTPGSWMLEHPNLPVRELYCKMKTQQLKPRIMVSYTREAFIYKAGNVRVTFDTDIRTSLFHTDFTDGSVNDISVSENDGSVILEVKYDAFLPEIISCLLQSGRLRQQAFSKYGACRRFG